VLGRVAFLPSAEGPDELDASGLQRPTALLDVINEESTIGLGREVHIVRAGGPAAAHSVAKSVA
jgi:hypothetical protein